jgi:hypothetical protein
MKMKKITVINRLENQDGEFIELTHNGADVGRVYRVEVKTETARFDHFYTSLNSELNERVARETYEESKQFVNSKVTA